MKIALFITCLADNFHPRGGIAAVKVLEHLGHEVAFPVGQTCCGQPMYNSGFAGEATTLARRMIPVFDGFEAVVTTSGSCAAMVREQYAPLFPEGSSDRRAAEDLAGRTFEFVELLVKVLNVDLRALSARWSGTATIHPSCHLRGLGLRDETATLAAQIEGLQLAPLENSEQCCGFGGMFSTQYPTISGGMVRDKVACIEASGADTVISSDPGCTMNIEGACRRRGVETRFRSMAEIVAESLGLLPREDA